jgi:hypothetical protein
MHVPKWYIQSLIDDLHISPENQKAFFDAVRPYNVKRRFNHDYWSLYAYGDFVKIVYVKASFAPKVDNKNGYKNVTVSSVSERLDNNISRAKSVIFELAACNEFQHFCTFTLDKSKRDRFDLKTFRRDLAQLIRNINRSRPEWEKIKYLVIPENHKDGAWHLHGLFQNLGGALEPFTLSDHIPAKIKNQIKEGKKVYNFPKYAEKFGFFTATDISDRLACAKYITKYVTKDIARTRLESGDHLYFASQGLKRREVVVKNCFDSCPLDVFDYENKYVKVKEIDLR